MKKLLVFLFPLMIGVACTAQEGNTSDVNVAQANELIQNEEVLVVDVRSSPEWDGGHIENAIHINLYSDEFESDIAKLDKSKEYVVYCHAGGRSATAVEKMKELGFTNVHNMAGGFSAWTEAGYKSVK